jgi:hypothetical protein
VEGMIAITSKSRAGVSSLYEVLKMKDKEKTKAQLINELMKLRIG